MKRKLLGTKRQILMRTEMIMREMNIRPIRAYRHSMFISSRLFWSVWRTGGKMQS